MIEKLYDKTLSLLTKMRDASIPYFRRLIRLVALPYCYLSLVNWKECTATHYQVFKDLVFIFFKLKYFPDNYSACRFWERDRAEWLYYYGSSYDPYQRAKLRKKVQRYEYEILYEDKEVCNQLCESEGLPIPEYYGSIDPSGNYIEKISNAFNNIKSNSIIIKPSRGSAGQGICMAVRDNNQIKIRSGKREVNLNEFVLQERSIIQEVVVQCDQVNQFSTSLNTIRMLTLLTKTNDVICISALMRFGVDNYYIDNWSAGGIAVGVDYKKGTLMEFAYDKLGNKYIKHPDSQIVFNNFSVPVWNDVVALSIKAQRSLPYCKLLGMDIGLSKKGPVIIEINGFPDLVMQEQTAGPLLKDINVFNEFKKYDLLINKYQKNLY